MRTFVILKPDSIDRGVVGKIISRFEDAGLEIKRISLRYKNSIWCGLHYKHLTPEVFEKVSPAMSGPLIGIVLEGYEAVSRVKKMVGSTLPEEAQPGTIRFDFCRDPAPRNLVHASDADKVEDEIGLFFDPFTG